MDKKVYIMHDFCIKMSKMHKTPKREQNKGYIIVDTVGRIKSGKYFLHKMFILRNFSAKSEKSPFLAKKTPHPDFFRFWS